MVVLTVTLGAYIYLLIADRDALRSETFSLSKLAIEKGLVGDNISGLIQPSLERRQHVQLTDDRAMPIEGEEP